MAGEIRVVIDGTEFQDNSGTEFDFGSVFVRSVSDWKTVRVWNDSTIENLNITGVTEVGTEFEVYGPATSVIPPTMYTDWFIRFVPTYPSNVSLLGPRSTTLTINSNDANEGVFTVRLVARADSPIIKVVNMKGYDFTQMGLNIVNENYSLDFGKVAKTFDRSKTLRVYNVGTSPLGINSLTIGGDPEFSIVTEPTYPASVPAPSVLGNYESNNYVDIVIEYNGQTVELNKAVVTINHDDVNSASINGTITNSNYVIHLLGETVSVQTRLEFNTCGCCDRLTIVDKTGWYDKDSNPNGYTTFTNSVTRIVSNKLSTPIVWSSDMFNFSIERNKLPIGRNSEVEGVTAAPSTWIHDGLYEVEYEVNPSSDCCKLVSKWTFVSLCCTRKKVYKMLSDITKNEACAGCNSVPMQNAITAYSLLKSLEFSAWCRKDEATIDKHISTINKLFSQNENCCGQTTLDCNCG